MNSKRGERSEKIPKRGEGIVGVKGKEKVEKILQSAEAEASRALASQCIAARVIVFCR